MYSGCMEQREEIKLEVVVDRTRGVEPDSAYAKVVATIRGDEYTLVSEYVYDRKRDSAEQNIMSIFSRNLAVLLDQ